MDSAISSRRSGCVPWALKYGEQPMFPDCNAFCPKDQVSMCRPLVFISVASFEHSFPDIIMCVFYYSICTGIVSGNPDMLDAIVVRGHPVSHDNRPCIETFQSVHPCSDDAIVTSHNRPHIKTSRSAPFCHDNGVVTSHNRPHIETFQSTGPYIPPHHCPTFASRVRPRIEIFQSAGPHTPS